MNQDILLKSLLMKKLKLNSNNNIKNKLIKVKIQDAIKTKPTNKLI